MATTEQQRQELAAFLRSRRTQLKPRDVGLAEGVGRRRTPGLRREEVAQISGVGLTWYTWLEQARDIPASPHVIEALARSFRLDEDERRHLFALAGVALPPPTSEHRQVPDPVQRMLDSLVPNPAYVLDEHFDILAWNASQTALWLNLATIEPAHRNLVWLMFTDTAVRSLVTDWPEVARSLVAQFRAAAGPRAGDTRFAQLAAQLYETSRDFAAWWDSYPVAEFNIAMNRLDHPVVGRLELDLLHLSLVEHPALTLVLHTPSAPADAERLQTMLQHDKKPKPRLSQTVITDG